MAVLGCPKKCTPSFFDKEDFRTNHEVLETIDGKWLARCEECGATGWQAIPGDKLTPAAYDKYPRLEPQSGTYVKSKSDMIEKLARKGYRRVD